MENSNSSSLRPPFSLPSAWGVDEVPRSDGSKSDKYYLEPGTGKKFRSLREVERYLNGETVSRRHKSNEPIASHRPRNDMDVQMSTISREEWLDRPPSKVNWSLASPKGDAWNPSIGDTLISDGEKQEWRKRFVSAMNDETTSAVMQQKQQLMEQPPQATENIQQTQSVEGGRQEEEGGLRRSSRTKKVAYHHQDFVYE